MFLVVVELFVAILSIIMNSPVEVVGLSSRSLPSSQRAPCRRTSSELLMASTTATAVTSVRQRVFVGGLHCNRTTLVAWMEQEYGPIEEVFMLPRTTPSSSTTTDTQPPPYAFVTFQDEDDAQQAITTNVTNPTTFREYYDRIEAAEPRAPPSKKHRVYQQKLDATHHAHWEEKLRIAHSHCTVVLQVQQSHVARFQDFLTTHELKHPSPTTKQKITILGSFLTPSRTISLIFVRGIHAQRLAQLFAYESFPIIGLNKLYAVDTNNISSNSSSSSSNSNISSSNIVRGDLTELIQDCKHKMQAIAAAAPLSSSTSSSLSSNNEKVIVRFNIFPPSLLRDLLHALEQEPEHHATLLASISPTLYTCTYTIVQLAQADDNRETDADPTKSTSSRINNNNNNKTERRHPRQQQALYLTGMTQRKEEEEQQHSATNANANTNSDRNKSSAQTRSPQRWKPSPPPPPQQQDTVCRAYHKLEEAFARYRYELPAGNELVALDCGSAPGGWTKFLLDYYQKETGTTTTTAPTAPRLKKIYCIDPADMSPIVIAQPEVVHVRHKIDAALMQWEEEDEAEKNEGDKRTTQIDIWVSDMCLHYVGSQIDTLLDTLRRRRPIIGSGTMFVLTIKCVVGHTKESFDNQVAEQRARIEDISRDVQTLHLFSNRSGERTLIGYIK